MNGDALELMQELGRIHADLKQDIGSVRTEVAGFRGNIEARVAGIEQDAKDDKFWGNVKSYSGIVGVAIHVAAHKLGFKI
jgi:hypothetical protein